MRTYATGALALMLATPAAFAALEGHVDLFGTNMAGASASLQFEERSLLGGSTYASADIDANAGPEIGVRALLADDVQPWLIGTELGGFKTRDPHLDVNAVQIALVGGIRTPRPLLARHGHGLRPYLLVGISSVVFDGTASAGGISVPVNTSSGFLSSGAADTVPVFAAGFEWRLSPRTGIVAEYRWREYDIEGMSTNSWVFPTSNSFVDGTLDAGGLMVGISWWPRPPDTSRFGQASPAAAEAATMPPPESSATEPPAISP